MWFARCSEAQYGDPPACCQTQRGEPPVPCTRPAPGAPQKPPEAESLSALGIRPAFGAGAENPHAEVDRLRRELEEERRRSSGLLAQLRDEQERSHDLHVQLTCTDQLEGANEGSRITRDMCVSKASTQVKESLRAVMHEQLQQPLSPWSWESEREVIKMDFLEDEEDTTQKGLPQPSFKKQGSLTGYISEERKGDANFDPESLKSFAPVKDEDLIKCFRGIRAGVPDRTDADMDDTTTGATTVTKGAGPRGDGFDKQYSWILALSLPNPLEGKQQCARPKGISETEAADIFSTCFKGEDRGGGSFAQAERFRIEKALFMRAFHQLPSVDGNKAMRRYAGDEPKGTDFWDQAEYKGLADEDLAQNFLELLRNVIVTKITLHCQLPVRTCTTEDRRSILVLVTATAHDLLQEADRNAFPTELDVRTVDPESLEPCCPRSFYPLLEWYIKQAPDAPNMEIVQAYKNVVRKLLRESPERLKRKSREVAFWALYEADAKAHLKGADNRPSVLKRITFAKQATSTIPVTQRPVNADKVKEKDHLYSSAKKNREIFDAFLRYLELKAEHGLERDAIQIMSQVNEEWGKPVLENWHTAIGLDRVVDFFQEFRLETYVGENANPWEWKSFECRARQTDTMLTSPFNGNERAKLLEGTIARQLDMAQLEARGFVSSVFPLDSREKIETQKPGCASRPSKLSVCWGLPSNVSTAKKAIAFVRGIFRPVPLSSIQEYYGEQIAFYFAFVELVCWWLIWPAIVGIITFVIQLNWNYDPRQDQAPRIRVAMDLFFAGTVAIWGTVVLECWKRRQASLAFFWGQRGIGQVEMARPAYHGIARRSPVTFEDGELHYSSRRRAKRQALSICLLLTMAILELVGTIYTGKLRGMWIKRKWMFFEQAQQITAVIEDVQMTMCGKIGYVLSWKLNDYENLRTGSEYINGLIAKVVCHQLWNRFHLYFYIAFLKADREGCILSQDGKKVLIEPEEMNGRMCYEEVGIQVTTVLCVEFAKNSLELLKPLVSTYFNNMFRPAPDVIAVDENNGRARISHICQEAMDRPLYGPTFEVDGTFADYLEIMVLLGHFTLFSLVFPLAPCLGFVLLLVELRVDGFKLFELVRRPLPRSAEGIGNWFHVVTAISWTAMFTNCGLVVYTMGAFDVYFGNLPRWVYFIFLSGLLLAFKAFVAFVVPDVPECINIAEKHQAWVRTMLKHGGRFGDKGQRAREPVDIAAVDLMVDDADTGQWRDPAEFGLSAAAVLERVKGMKKRVKRSQNKKKGAVAVAFVAGAGGGAMMDDAADAVV